MRIHRFALCTIAFSISIGGTVLASAKTTDLVKNSTSNKITLEQALDCAFRNRQELTVYKTDLDAAALKLKHAGLPPNPELGVEWNNLGSDLPSGDSKETIISLSQPLEIGGKPSARKGKGQAEILRLQHEQAVTWLDIAAEVRTAFLEVLGARERLNLQREAAKTASELVDITREQVAAGKLAGTEETRAEARKAEIASETQRLKRILADAEMNLANLLAKPDSSSITAEGHLLLEAPIPDRQALSAEMKSSPLLALRRSESQLAKTNLSLEQANAWSDPTLSLAVRDVPDKDARAVAIGVSIPLPLFQRNQVAVAEAGATVHKATANEVAAARRLQTELIKTHANLIAAEQEIRALRTEGLGKSAQASEAVREGFRAGKFRFSDVLEASQALMAMKARYLDAILDLNRAVISLDRLLGKPAFPTIAKDSATTSSHRSTP